MYFVVTHTQHHIPCRWCDLSIYEQFEINADDKYFLAGKRKDDGEWDTIKKFETRNEIEVWCNENIPLGGQNDF